MLSVEVLVEHEYIATEQDELTIKPGDIITNVEKLSDGWWEGMLNGKRGLFPDNFVKVSISQLFHDYNLSLLFSIYLCLRFLCEAILYCLRMMLWAVFLMER